MIKEWLDTYQPRNTEEATQALREIMQEVALAGLYRSGFFENAAFYGGTCLRLFYGLERFSEDLDFSLMNIKTDFSLQRHFRAVINEFESLGMKVSIREKVKSTQSSIDSAFLKSETKWNELVLESTIPQIQISQRANIKIKLEVDTLPPLGFETEEKLLLKPFSFYVRCFVIEDLFAGKMHALLFRKWGKNVKGRDWYDMEWYIRKGIHLNLQHFIQRAKDSGDWNKETITVEEFKNLLKNRIESVDLSQAKTDISRFITNPDALSVWSKNYFHDLTEHLKVEA